MTRFLTLLLLPAIGNIAFELPGVDGVVSYSTAIRLNFRFRRVFDLVGLKFSFNESDSKLPNRHGCRILNANLKSWRSSESLNMAFAAHSLASTAPSAGLLELSSVGCGAHAIEKYSTVRKQSQMTQIMLT